jgi:hypothetical protein
MRSWFAHLRRDAGVTLLMAVVLTCASACTMSLPSPAPTPSGSLGGLRLTYAQNANHLAACDSDVSLQQARQAAEDALAAARQPGGSIASPGAADSALAAAEQAWGPFGYPNDDLGAAFAAADKAVAAVADGPLPPAGGGPAASGVTAAEQTMNDAFDVLQGLLAAVGVSCP